ncbi:shikimate dehydrogenase [Arboricoccus pini]|uniref:Shikimate dehydrogenase n=1 Tax=Arboricoccus pini TaxID=1963835 RepID=A0A212RJ98_9PROT|nr:shikimate 5-dehydrogenase [Arboricoccus pini]SNB72482.1 shikimate dehydrogenase [Arboricoccus pini]
MSKLSINRDTKLCMSLSGRPGNFGTRFQNYLYDELNLDFVYKAFTTTDLPAAIGGIRALNIRGCAVSMPFKEACIPLVDELDPSAAAIGSVNTIVNDDGHLHAYNTDYIAIERLIERHAIDEGTRFVLLGSGGMAKAVASAMRDKGLANGTIVARNAEAGQALATSCGYDWRPKLDFEPAMLVNVTPIGMAGGPEADSLAFSARTVAAASIVIDVVALPPETPLIRLARELGKTVITGAEVIVLQGLEQFVLYTGVRPDDALLARAAAFALG